MMSKLDIISEILNEEFEVADNKLIEENKDHQGIPFTMEIPIVYGAGINCKLYKFYIEGKTIFPYFKNGHGLRRTCDYIMFAEEGENMYVFPIELKMGTRNSGGEQLKASRVFVD